MHKHSHTHRKLHGNANTHPCTGKGLAFRQHSHCPCKRRVNCFILAADRNSLASYSVTLTQWGKCSKQYKGGEIEEKGEKYEKQRDLKKRWEWEQRQAKRTLAVHDDIKRRGLYSQLASLPTTHFCSFSPPLSYLKGASSQPETCHISVLWCVAQTDKETRNDGGLRYHVEGERGDRKYLKLGVQKRYTSHQCAVYPYSKTQIYPFILLEKY